MVKILDLFGHWALVVLTLFIATVRNEIPERSVYEGNGVFLTFDDSKFCFFD